MISRLRAEPELAKHFAVRLISAAKKLDEREIAKKRVQKQLEKVKNAPQQYIEQEMETFRRQLDILLEKEGVILDKQAREDEFSAQLKSRIDELERKIQSADRIVDSLTLIRRKLEEYADIKKEEKAAEQELIKKGMGARRRLLRQEVELEKDIEGKIRKKEIEKIEKILNRMVTNYRRLKKLEKYPKAELEKIEKKIKTLKESISRTKLKAKAAAKTVNHKIRKRKSQNRKAN